MHHNKFVELSGRVPFMQRLILFVSLCLAMGPALEYGGIWSLRAHPWPNVTVRLQNGREVTGELSRAWSKEWIIRTQDAEVQFPERGGYQSMSFPPPRARVASGPRSAVAMIFARWRSFVPFALLWAAAFGCLLDWLGVLRIRKLKRGAVRELGHGCG